MAYFVADEKLQGYYVSGGVTINIVKYHFECDDAASLPAQTAFISSKKVKISMASTAHTIDTDALYKMDSSGAWVQQSQPWQPLADYGVLSNKPQINGHILTGNQSGADLGLQNTLTFDNTPTQDSTNPVTSGGVWTDQQRQDALQTDDRAALVELVDNGAKNKITFKSLRRSASNYGTSVYTEGVMFTLNADGTVTVNREVASSSNAYVTLCTDSNVIWSADDFCTGGYVLSGCPSGGAQNTYRLVAAKGSYAAYDSGNGVVLPSTSETGVGINIIIYGGYNAQNLTFRPMICTTAEWKISQTFQPYRPSWQEMYDMILALQ